METERISKYVLNETMKLLGKQSVSNMTPEAVKQIDHVLYGNAFSSRDELALDAYSLGYINGKRAARSKKKKESCKHGGC